MRNKHKRHKKRLKQSLSNRDSVFFSPKKTLDIVKISPDTRPDTRKNRPKIFVRSSVDSHRHRIRNIDQDRRYFHPDPFLRIHRRVDGVPARTRVYGPNLSIVPYQVSFKDYRRVVTCVRRSERRRALFGKGHVGRGVSLFHVKHNFTEDSEIVCK